jgi:hypothetical protein
MKIITAEQGRGRDSMDSSVESESCNSERIVIAQRLLPIIIIIIPYNINYRGRYPVNLVEKWGDPVHTTVLRAATGG